jgi:hypothetical protein
MVCDHFPEQSNALLRFSQYFFFQESPSAYRASKRTRMKRVISTLNPEKLLPSDFVDISRWKHSTFASSPTHVPRSHSYEPAKHPTFNITFEMKRDSFIPFPQSTCGFLYYHSPPDLPPSAGQLRFRLTPNNQPSSFANGSDLMLSNGLPWHIPVWWIASRPPLAGARHQLLRDNLVTDEFLTKCKRIFPIGDMRHTSLTLHALGQPFPIRCDKTQVSLWVVGRDKVEPLTIQNAFRDNRRGCQPYRGEFYIPDSTALGLNGIPTLQVLCLYH